MDRHRKLELRLKRQAEKRSKEEESMGGIMRLRGKHCRCSKEVMESNVLSGFQRSLLSIESKNRDTEVLLETYTLKEQMEIIKGRMEDVVVNIEVERYSEMSNEYLGLR